MDKPPPHPPTDQGSDPESTWRARLDYHLKNSPLATIEWDANLYVTRWGPAAERMFGWTAAEVLGKPPSEWFFVPKEDTSTVSQIIEQLLGEPGCRNISRSRNFKKDGSITTSAWYNFALQDESGKTTSILSLVQNVSDQCAVEAEIRASEGRFRELADAVDQIIWVGDVNPMRVAYCNSAFETVWGRTSNELLEDYQVWFDAIAPEDREHVISAFTTWLDSGEDSFRIEYRIVRPDGTMRWVSDRGLLLRNGHGQPSRIVGVTDDITTRKLKEVTLKDADRRKDQFIAMLGHKLRKPLSAIQYAVQMLKAPDTIEIQRQGAISVIEREISHQTRMLNDILDTSRLTQHKLLLELVPVDLCTVIEQSIADFRARFHEKGVALVSSISGDPVIIAGDHIRLTQIVNNLLSNALKFTPCKGTVTVLLDSTATDAVLVVSDTGEGMDGSTLPHVFDTFFQGPQSLARPESGLGLGLALVRGILELHGGKVQAHSRGTGKGCAVSLQLPRLIVTVPPERLATRQEHTKRSLRAILVDDNADAVLTLSALLRHSGHDVRGVHSPADCLALLDTFQPDVCICDIGLPGMSGYELVRKLRAHPNTKDARLIAVSGYARKQDVVMSLESGFDVHMAKPVAFDELLREMQGEKAPHLDR